jgi:hypothetical protein
MSTLTFKALIDGVHYDPKKGTLKIQLIAASHISIDRLTTLGPGDENVNVTLQSAQVKITDVGDPIELKEPDAIPKETEKWLEKAADEVGGKDEAEQIIIELPLSEADRDKDEVVEGKD